MLPEVTDASCAATGGPVLPLEITGAASGVAAAGRELCQGEKITGHGCPASRVQRSTPGRSSFAGRRRFLRVSRPCSACAARALLFFLCRFRPEFFPRGYFGAGAGWSP